MGNTKRNSTGLLFCTSCKRKSVKRSLQTSLALPRFITTTFLNPLALKRKLFVPFISKEFLLNALIFKPPCLKKSHITILLKRILIFLLKVMTEKFTEISVPIETKLMARNSSPNCVKITVFYKEN